MANIDISQYIEQDCVSLDVRAQTSQGVIKELVEKIYIRTGMVSPPVREKTACAEVINREKMQSIGIGNGLAFPPARKDGWGRLKMAVGISREGIDFKSVDGKAVKIVFLLISAAREPYIVSQAMSAIIRFLKDDSNRQSLAAGAFYPQILVDKFKAFYSDTPD